MISSPTRWSSKEIDQFDLNNSDDPDSYEEYLENYRRFYRASLDHLDRHIASFLDDLSEIKKDTTVIVTADHGQNLGFSEDDQLVGHVGSLSEGVLHVPLELINPPPGYPEQIEDMTTLLELPTLITGVASDDTPSISREVVPAERIGEPLGRPENFEYWDRMIRCAYRGEVKYSWDSLDTQQKHELRRGDEFGAKCVDDPTKIPTWATEQFEGTIEEYKEKAREKDATSRDMSDIDNATRDRLSDLGYL